LTAIFRQHFNAETISYREVPPLFLRFVPCSFWKVKHLFAVDVAIDLR